jgi:hypothetical protein
MFGVSTDVVLTARHYSESQTLRLLRPLRVTTPPTYSGTTTGDE